MSTHSEVSLPLFYQAESLQAYSERLIHGFTGKPASFGGPDKPGNNRREVLANRTRLLEQLGLPLSEWIIPQQVHGHRIGRTGDRQFNQTDAIILLDTNQPVMLLYADCVPILLYDPVHHAGAVIHAGWRGTHQQIVKEAVFALQNATGSRPKDICAVIGPSIGHCCFQVSSSVAEQLARAHDMPWEPGLQRDWIDWDETYPDNPRVDLKILNRNQLEATGIEQIEVLSHCTRCSDEDLFSFRRGEDGRNSAFMILR